ncbi:MAG: divalent metal cation transporter [bacterium]|nr:divalent metal cation transporter [bacterium]
MKKLKAFLKSSRSGIITGGADNDPAGISTYSIAGATNGFSQIWLMILATPMLIAVQAMCARLGDVKRQGLATILKEHFPKPLAILAVVILVVCNTVTIGADLAGMAEATSLIFKTNYLIWIIPFAILIWYVVIFENYRMIRTLLFWLVAVFSSYILAGILANPDWGQVLKAIVFPSVTFTPIYFMAAVGLLGTTITPYLFFWQTEEEIEEKDPPQADLKKASHEDAILAPGFILSNLISIFIMISTGAVLFGKGGIQTAADAARALEPLAGSSASLLFAVGIVGAGLLAVPILATSSAYAVAELFGWRESLSAKLQKAKGFYFVISCSLIIGLVLAFLQIDPIKALFYSQILAGVLAPVILVLILILCNNKKIMGQYHNGWFDNLFGILTVLVMLLAAGGMFWQIAI